MSEVVQAACPRCGGPPTTFGLDPAGFRPWFCANADGCPVLFWDPDAPAGGPVDVLDLGDLDDSGGAPR